MKAIDAVKNLRALADLLEKHGDAPLYMSSVNVWFEDKDAFLQVAKDFPRPFAKVDDETTTGDLILRKGNLGTDGTINIRIRRSAVCTLIEPARPAKYEMPIQRIAELMGVHWTTVSNYRKDAVKRGFLIPVEQYIAHRRAGHYLLIESSIPKDTEPLTKTTHPLTSGLVRIDSAVSPSESLENSPSEKCSLATDVKPFDLFAQRRGTTGAAVTKRERRSMEVPRKVLDSVYGSVADDWHQHSNGGGWVYKTAKVEPSAYLHPTSIVSGNARVYGNAQVSGDAWVSGNAAVIAIVDEAVKGRQA